MSSKPEIHSTPHHIVCLEECHCPIPKFSFHHTYTGYETSTRDPAELLTKLHSATIAITTIIPITPAILDGCPHLKCVFVMATGVEWVDREAFRARGVTVMHAPQANVSSVSEHAIALYFAARRKIVEMHWRCMREDEYAQKRTLIQRFDGGVPPHTASQEVMAILGYGALGRRIEGIARALGMQVLVAERKGVMAEAGREGRVAFETALQRATVVMVTVAKNGETIDLVGEEELKMMRRDALVVNVSRGGIVNEVALVRALREGRIGGAATDVFDGEPPVRGTSVLLDESIPNLTVSPHIAWFSETTVRNMQDLLLRGVEGYVEGSPINVVC